MKIILLEKIKNIGDKGEIKDVAEGYAMNFLIPKKMAEIATPEAAQKLKAEQEVTRQKDKEEEGKLKNIASDIKEKGIIVKAKAEKGKLFGSITAKDIAKEIKSQGFEISEKNIILGEPIKNIGEKEITIDLGKNVKIRIIILIEKA